MLAMLPDEATCLATAIVICRRSASIVDESLILLTVASIPCAAIQARAVRCRLFECGGTGPGHRKTSARVQVRDKVVKCLEIEASRRDGDPTRRQGGTG